LVGTEVAQPADQVAQPVKAHLNAIGHLSEIEFLGIEPDKTYRQWVMDFDHRGELKAVEVMPAGPLQTHEVPQPGSLPTHEVPQVGPLPTREVKDRTALPQRLVATQQN
ncbi:MAG TPA: hypothetical protein VMD29_04245, partial [Terracidiphilus sp.]|nr:hypothetical protein [Terracidiphilus sp.]